MQPYIRTACIVILTVAGTLLLLEARRLVHDLRVEVLRVGIILTHVDDAAANASAASETAKEAALEQKKYWAMTSLQTYKVITDLKGFIVRTDRSVNGELVPRLSDTLRSTNNLASQAAIDLHGTVVGLQPTLGNLARASEGAANDLDNPSILRTLEHVDETSSHVAAATSNLAATTADLKQVADKFRDDYTHPGRTLWTTLKYLINLTFETRGAIAK